MDLLGWVVIVGALTLVALVVRIVRVRKFVHELTDQELQVYSSKEYKNNLILVADTGFPDPERIVLRVRAGHSDYSRLLNVDSGSTVKFRKRKKLSL